MRRKSKYEQFAIGCRELARTTKNGQHKNFLQEMAAMWDKIAREQRDKFDESETAQHG
ncbi:MAG TPA: hypothetical protein VIY68_01400 [Steroidobacteraceae bacterium]